MTQYTAPESWVATYPQGYEPPGWTTDSGNPSQASFEDLAVGMLWNWTGRIFGTSQDTIRPCKIFKPKVPPATSFEGAGPWPINPGFGSGHSVVGWWGVGAWMPVLVGGNWYNIQCGTCQAGSGACQCQPDEMTVLSLPGPVQSVDSVIVNGTALDPSTYWVRNQRWLTRSDGGNWALTQDFTQPDGSNNTWTVTWTHGIPVPEGGAEVAGLLASELMKAWAQDASCALPSRMQSLHREGVTVMLPRQLMGRGGAVQSRNASDQVVKVDTGIWMIDNWVNAVNIPRYSTGVRSVDTTPVSGMQWPY